MRILGIDPGYNIIGYGVIETNGCKVIDYGVITTPKNMPISKRLHTIYQAACELMETFKPDEVAFEELFFNTNTTTAIPVAEARGVILYTLEKHGIKISEYTPLQVKQALVGYGRAKKDQVEYMVKDILKLDKMPKIDDTTDALAIAICHANSNKYNSYLEKEIKKNK